MQNDKEQAQDVSTMYNVAQNHKVSEFNKNNYKLKCDF